MHTHKRPLRTYSRSEKRKLEDEETFAQRSVRRRVIHDCEQEDGQKRKSFSVGTNTARKLVRDRGSDLQDFSSSSDPIRDSDDARDATTPSSSPPPSLPTLDPTEEYRTHIDRLIASSRPALKGINGNAQITSFFQTPAPQKASIDQAPNPPKQILIQSQINLGLSSQRTCKTCGMTYVPSNAEDSALHSSFHSQSIDGVEMKKNFRRYYESSAQWRGGNNDIVIRVDMHHNIWHRRRMAQILEVVTRELGAVVIPMDELISTIDLSATSEGDSRCPTRLDIRKSLADQDNIPDLEAQPRYQAFLYLSGTKCVGVCLIEEISMAYVVLPICDGSTTSDSPILVNDTPSPAMIGISRIWTSKSYRGKGVAVAMLNSVISNYKCIGRVPKDMVAFSQPTTSGAMLARKWFGKQHGWLVYKD